MKTQILAAIGEKELQPAASVNAALAANDRLKYAFSLLQMAVTHGAHPDQPAVTLKRERIACGIDDPDFDSVVTEARMLGKSCHVAGATRIIAHIADDLRLMAAPVLAANPDGFAARLDTLLGAMPVASDDLRRSLRSGRHPIQSPSSRAWTLRHPSEQRRARACALHRIRGRWRSQVSRYP
jgi:hypothetical protein